MDLGLKETIKTAIKEVFQEMLVDMQSWLVNISFNVALFGGAICIILWVAGLKDGFRYAGILIVSHVIIRAILG